MTSSLLPLREKVDRHREAAARRMRGKPQAPALVAYPSPVSHLTMRATLSLKGRG